MALKLDISYNSITSRSGRGPAPALCLSLKVRSYNSLATDWHLHQHFGTFTRPAIHFQRPSNPYHTFLHADQTKVFSLPVLRLLVIKTTSVVLHAELHPARIESQIDQNILRLRVSHRIINGFLSNA